MRPLVDKRKGSLVSALIWKLRWHRKCNRDESDLCKLEFVAVAFITSDALCTPSHFKLCTWLQIASSQELKPKWNNNWTSAIDAAIAELTPLCDYQIACECVLAGKACRSQSSHGSNCQVDDSALLHFFTTPSWDWRFVRKFGTI